MAITVQGDLILRSFKGLMFVVVSNEGTIACLTHSLPVVGSSKERDDNQMVAVTDTNW